MLSSLLESLKDETKASLAVADPKLGNAIAQIPGLSLKPITDSSTQDVYRAIREYIGSLIELVPAEIDSTRLGLSHSLSRHKLKFSADKVDTMIVQSISSLDVLDKQLNTYAMRVKEWYGWSCTSYSSSPLLLCHTNVPSRARTVSVEVPRSLG